MPSRTGRNNQKRHRTPGRTAHRRGSRRRGNRPWRERLISWARRALYALLGIVALSALVYFVLPGIFYSIYNRAIGSYRPLAGEVYDGIDVSHHNGTINWARVSDDPNIKFAYIKATEGYNHTDDLYHYNIENARKAGIKVGSYHLLTTRTAMRTQFLSFSKEIDQQDQDLLPMVDIEEHKMKGWSRDALRDSLRAFINLVKEHYDVNPVIYCSYKFYRTRLSPEFDDQILFLARYGREEPTLEHDKKEHDIWQFTEHGTIAGIKGDVDLDRFGSSTTLADISY